MIASSVLFAAFLVVSARGWRVIPDDARFPVSLGVPPSLTGTVSKRSGLVVFLLIGSWFFATSAFSASQGYAIGWIG
ncbi:MAG: hypothetical protein ACR2L3_03840, partial [Actinomycetota bacterium]